MNRFLQSPLLSADGVAHGFSTRNGGSSPAPWASLNLGGSTGDEPGRVEVNLARLCEDVGIDRDGLATVAQVHGDAVFHAREDDRRLVISSEPDGMPIEAPEADAIIAHAGTSVGVRTADCVPILLFDRGTGLAAAVHAGWRGTFARIVVRTVERMSACPGVEVENLLAAIGPAIGPCCYEVSPDLGEKFVSALSPSVVKGVPAAPRLDLPEANRLLLLESGVHPASIDLLRRCTSCEADLFYSHRRDQGRTGRHLSLVRAR